MTDKLTPYNRRGIIGEGKEKEKNLAAGALLFYKLEVGKKILLYGEKGNRKKIKMLELLLIRSPLVDVAFIK